MVDSIVFGKRFEYGLQVGVISDYGVSMIRNYIWTQDFRMGEWWGLNPEYKGDKTISLPHDWKWDWMVSKGDYRGTFPKRVSAFYHKRYGITCPKSFLAELGNIAKRHSANHPTYSFEFTVDLNWYDGEFDDEGSCYWWYDGYPLDAMMQNNAFAVCFFEGERGIARAWMYKIEPEVYVLWNGYGYDAFSITRVVSGLLGASFKQIRLMNNGFTGGTIYINGGYGYLIASEENLDKRVVYDLKFDVMEHHCSNCNQMLHSEHVARGADGYDYCDSCFMENFTYCSQCDEAEWTNETVYDGNEEPLCRNCARHYVRCESCSLYFERGETFEVDGNRYCENCHDKL